MAAVDTSGIEHDLRVAFAAFMEAFMAAQSAELDAAAILSSHMREAMGEEEWRKIPLSVKMMLG